MADNLVIDDSQGGGLSNDAQHPYEEWDEENGDLNRGGPATTDQTTATDDPARPDDQDIRDPETPLESLVATQQTDQIDATNAWQERREELAAEDPSNTSVSD